MSIQLPHQFCFQLFLDLADGRIGNLFINQHSDPYLESTKFCAKFFLPSSLVLPLAQYITKQMKKSQQKLQVKQKQLSSHPIIQNTQSIRHSNFGSLNSSPSKIKNQLTSQQLVQRIYKPRNITQKNEDLDRPVFYNQSRVCPFENLYRQAQQIEYRKSISRQKFVQKNTFKPAINQISRKIVEGKRNKYINTINQKQNQFKRKNIGNKNYSKDNLENIIYKVSQNNGKENKKNYLISAHSQQLAKKSRMKGFEEIFLELVDQATSELSYRNLNFEKMSQKQKIMLPIFEEMKMMKISLNLRQFIQAGMKLIPYLHQKEKIILRQKSESKIVETVNGNRMNSRNKLLLKQQKQQYDIHDRGIIYLNRSRSKLSKMKDDLYRKQMKNCSFHPKIN